MLRAAKAQESFPINVAGSSSFGVDPKVNAETTYNMFESDGWLIPFAGYKRVLEVFPSGQGRALFSSNRGGFMIAVINQAVIRINKDLTRTQIGIIETTQGEVFIDENLASQICLVDGNAAYIYNYETNSALVKQTGGVFAANLVPSYVTYHNDQFLLGNGLRTPNGAAWYAFERETDTTISQIQPALALQTKPDYARAIVRIGGQSANVLVIGSTVCEIHQQVGGLQNYQRNNFLNIDYGTQSLDTIDASDEYVAFLGQNEKSDPVIMVFAGQQSQRISTDGIDRLLKNLKRPDKATANFYRQDGHLFYILTFWDEEDNLTLAYDFNNQKFYNLTDYDLGYFPARKIVQFNNTYYFVSLKNGSLYQMDSDLTTYDEYIDGTDTHRPPGQFQNWDIPRIRVCAPMRSARRSRYILNRVGIAIEQGNQRVDPIDDCNIYIITEDGKFVTDENGIYLITEDSPIAGCVVEPYKPRVDLAISIDGGVTYSNYVSRELNSVGNRKNLLSWNRLGHANETYLKFRFINAGKVLVTDGFCDVRA